MKMCLNKAEKIAIFRALQLGDILCSIPAIRALRLAKPHASITFIGLAHTESLIKRFSHYIDDFIAFPGYPGLPEQPYDGEKFNQFVQEIASRKFDIILQMQGNGSIVNNMLASLSAGNIAGFCMRPHEQNEQMLLYPDKIHEIQRHLTLMRHLGISNSDTRLEFPITEHDRIDFMQLNLPLQTDNYMVVHPGSRGEWRQWPAFYFANIADHCVEKGYAVVLTGTKAEKEITEQVASLMQHPCINLCGKTSLGVVAILIERCKALVCNCTGVSHLAAALGKKSVVISMDGEPDRWAPLDRLQHHTLDWTKNPDYHLVFRAVKRLLIEN